MIDFWRRWHITLSAILRDYVYISLGGGRHGSLRRSTNLLLVMLVGGLWHGANWTFVAWGALHGGFLIVNHAWRDFGYGEIVVKVLGPKIWALCCWMLTFLAVTVAWVFFRSETFTSAWSMLGSMFYVHDARGALPPSLGIGPWPKLIALTFVAMFLPTTAQIFNLAAETKDNKVSLSAYSGAS